MPEEKILYNGKPIEAKILDFTPLSFSALPYSSQLHTIYREVKTLIINDRRFKIIHIEEEWNEDKTVTLHCQLEEEWV